MMIWIHCSLFLAGLAAALALGLLASRWKRLAIALSAIAVFGILPCLFLPRREDILVRLARLVPMGDQILFFDVWIGWPLTFMLAALAPQLAKRGDRRAARLLLGAVFGISSLLALVRTAWPMGALIGLRDADGICLQSTEWSCGAASVVNFLRGGCGIESTEREMARACGVMPLHGATMAGAWRGISKEIEGTGLRATLLHPTFAELKGLRPPVILGIRLRFLLNHMVVLEGWKDGSAVIADPLKGNVRWSELELAGKWLGDAIALERK